MSKVVDKLLDQIEECLRDNSFRPLETERTELKDASTSGDWKSIHETVCAFLNTEGGFVIFGIKEKQSKGKKEYIFTGHQENNEGNLKKIADAFTDDKQHPIEVAEFLHHEIKPFWQGQVAVLYVEKLPENRKFIFYKGKAYERILTGDYEIKPDKLARQQEYKQEIELAREIEPLLNTTLQDLDIDKLNEYIILLNRETKIETIKADIESARPFLERKQLVKDNHATLLGILVCGKHPDDFLRGRCQVDCFVDSPITVAQNKKIIKDNILPLMEASTAFIYRNIQIGISIENGGTSVPEYPEKLIRESVNNALAHRDYYINKYINIIIKPNQYIEIRNPGSFKPKLLIEHFDHEIPLRRIIPGLPGSKNPRLADILKVFEKWEGRGNGMATLVNACLQNQIDLPYYKFYSREDLALIVPKGQLLDESVETLLTSYDGFIEQLLDGQQLTNEQKIVLAYIYKSELQNANHRYTILLTPDNNHLHAIKSLEQHRVIYKHPLSPDLYPIYLLHRQLIRQNYNQELRQLFGGDFDILDNLYKDVLQIIYRHNHFSREKTVSARQVSRLLYLNQQPKPTDIKTFDNFMRKIRRIFEQLESKRFIVKENNQPKYLLNTSYNKTTPSLFSTV